MAVRYVNPETHVAPTGMFSHVAIAESGRLAFIAGQVALDDSLELVAPGDPAGKGAGFGVAPGCDFNRLACLPGPSCPSARPVPG